MSKIAVVVDQPFANIAKQLSTAIGAGAVSEGAVMVQSVAHETEGRDAYVTVVIRCPVIPEEMARLADHVV